MWAKATCRATPSFDLFVVHGHDLHFRDEVVAYMRDILHMLEPVVLDGVASAGRTVIEKFEDEAGKCNLAVVLLTPDDKARTSEGISYRTARPNVWIELGYFMATFGRKTGRTLLIYRKGLDIPTDLSGLVYVDASAGMTDANVSKRLETELNAVVTSGLSVPPPSTSIRGGSFDVSGRLQLVGR